MNFIINAFMKLYKPYLLGKISTKKENSKVYAQFCKIVYGHDLKQFNMTNMNLLNKLIEEADFNKDSHVLDIGCNCGNISEYISGKSGAKVVGIDIIDKAIKIANKRSKSKTNKLSFFKMSMDDLNFQDQIFTHIMAIDSIFFAKDLAKTVKDLDRILKPGGKMLFFYGMPGRTEEKVKADDTKLAQELKANNLIYKNFDYADEESAHWQKSYDTAELLKNDFIKEGNQFLYHIKSGEATNQLKMQEKYPRFRYLYVVSK